MRNKFLLAMLFSVSLFAQAEDPFLFKPARGLNTITPVQQNLFLHSAEHFSVYSEFNSSSGEYRRFIDPGKQMNAIVGLNGYKIIDEAQSFRGEFKVFKQIRQDWNWIFVRDYSEFNPNLIGDSTSGTTRYNGIEMSADYKYLFNPTDHLGAKLSYLVDEALKQLTPRPVSEHRDIKFEMFGSFGLLPSLIIRGGVQVGDLNESISYREDQGGLTQETILLKFTGIDLPSVVRKKTETRYQYANIYGGEAGLNWFLNDVLSVDLNYSGSLLKSIQKDDALDPRQSGYFRSLNDEVKLNCIYLLNADNKFKFSAEYRAGLDWARAPERNVVFTEVNETYSGARISHDLNLNDALSIYYGIKYSQYSLSYDDYFSAAFLSKKKSSIFADAGAAWLYSADLSFGGSIYYGTDNHISGFIIAPAAGSAYYSLRVNDLRFLYADLNYFGVSADAKIKISRGYYIRPRAGYSIFDPKSGNFSGSKNNFFINVSYLSDL